MFRYQLRNLLVVAIVCLPASVGFAQEREIFREDFSNNDKEWALADEENFTSEITSGVLKITRRDDAGFRYLWQSVPLDMSKDVLVRIKVRQLSGALDNQFGFVFNTDDAENLYEFTISSDKKARLQRYKKGEKQSIIDEIDVPSIADQGQWNIIELRKQADAVSFFVNGEFALTYTGSYYLVFGSKFGPFVRWGQVVEYDEITVTEITPKPITFAEGFDAASKRTRLSTAINTEADELVDCISPDGQLLAFARTGHSGNTSPIEKGDIWFSEKNASGEWQPATNPGKPLNNAAYNFSVALSQDVNSLYVQGIYNADGTSSASGGISVSNRTVNGWSTPTKLPVEDLVNNSGVVNTHVSPDGQVLVLSIQDENSFGYNDLYVSFRKKNANGTPIAPGGENSVWTKPKNLGPVINTVGGEFSPFIAADGKTLYFSSNGHPGLGGSDVYVTVREDDTWLKWSKPRNLGPPINTDEHDKFFVVPAKGDVGYFSSYKDAIGGSDIFSVPLPKSAAPQATQIIRGNVYNAETKAPISASVVYEDLVSGEEIGRATSNPSTGAYSVALSQGKQFAVHAEASGFYPVSESVDTRDLTEYSNKVQDLFLSPIKENVSIRLNNVFFATGSAELREESFAELNRLVKFLLSNNNSIELGGHTDNVGEDKANEKLSQDRVNAVRAYLMKKNVDASRLSAKGYGESAPVASNDTPEGRQANRRVEFKIVGKK